MENYIGTKVIQAEPMTDIDFEIEKSMYNNAKSVKRVYESGISILRRDGESTACLSRQRDAKAGYKVRYEDGYTSWSPKEVFERCYRIITNSEIKLIKS